MMEAEKKIEFTRRITGSNRSSLVVVMFEMFFTYIEDAKICRAKDEHEQFKENVNAADQVLSRLEDTLDFKYELSANLYRLYRFSRDKLSAAKVHYRVDELDTSCEIITPIYEAFKEVAKTDTSKPMMENAEQVYAGMTYGKSDINESYVGSSGRGYLA